MNVAKRKQTITVSGGSLFHFAATREDVARRSRAVLKGMKEGWLKLCIDHVLLLAEAEKAHRLLEGKGAEDELDNIRTGRATDRCVCVCDQFREVPA